MEEGNLSSLLCPPFLKQKKTKLFVYTLKSKPGIFMVVNIS